LSVNNGLAYQHVLASGVPNNGKYCVKLPDGVTSSNARIRVEAADNIFFDISNAGFKLLPPAAPSFSLCAESLVELACAPTAFTTQISTGGIGGFNSPITLSASGLPAGATATFSPNPVAPGGTSTMTVDFTGDVLENTFDVAVTGTSDTLSSSSAVTFTVVQNDFSSMALQTPADGAQNVDIGPWLYWNGAVDADKYEVQVATSPSFEAGTILISNANVVPDSFKVSPLGEGKICYWRVRPINECGGGPWTEPFVFITKVQNCATLMANDLPKNISANGTPTVESKITVNGTGILVEDVNVKKVQGNHTFMQDLEVRLISPAGTNVLLFKDKCGGYNGNFNMGFDDSANGPFSCPPPQNGTIVKPTELLSAMSGQNSAGAWTLRVKDNVISSGGTLQAFELELCSSVSLNPPFIVNNNPLQLPGGSNAGIGDDLLKVEDPNNSASQLVFTLITVPKFGDLRVTGSPMQPGEQFTQADISNGLLRYYDYGLSGSGDNFRFSATDGEGGLVAGTFSIQAVVGTNEPLGNIAFALAPNPASESVRLFVSQPLDSDSRVTLLNLAGQQVHTWNLASGATSLLLNVADLPKGVYLVSVENEKGKGVKKVVVQ
jgi:subtilisin-like proprotein convertase family protein